MKQAKHDFYDLEELAMLTRNENADRDISFDTAISV